MRLIIAEKPSLAKAIASALNENSKSKNGYIECDNNTIVTWCFGHMLRLKLPKEINPVYKKWDLNNPILNYDLLNVPLTPDKKTETQYRVIKQLIVKANEIINACDPDREGELIFQEIISHAKVKNKKIKRFWCHSLTTDEIKARMLNLEDDMKSLKNAAFLRQYGDYCYGLNSTMMLSAKTGATTSVGRVQTPTLALVVKRDLAIQNFESKKYYQYKLIVNDSEFLSTEKFDTPDEAKEKAISIKSLKISTEHKEKQLFPKKLFSLSTFQKHMSKKYKWTAKQTLDILQTLYEKKLTSYPRTDTDVISEKTAEHLNSKIRNLGKKTDFDVIQNKAKGNVGSHEALTPTCQTTGIDTLNELEQLAYENIMNRFLAHYMFPAKVDEVIQTATDEHGNVYKNTGKTILEKGYLTYENDLSDSVITQISDGTYTDFKKTLIEKNTTPPTYFNDGTLISKMKKLSDDETLTEEEMKILNKVEGIGTEATRANTIEELIKKGYLIRDKSFIKSSDLGKKLISLVSKTTASDVKLTAQFEMILEQVANGKLSVDIAKNQFDKLTEKIVSEIKQLQI